MTNINANAQNTNVNANAALTIPNNTETSIPKYTTTFINGFSRTVFTTETIGERQVTTKKTISFDEALKKTNDPQLLASAKEKRAKGEKLTYDENNALSLLNEIKANWGIEK